MIAFNVNNVLIIHPEEPIRKGTVTIFNSNGCRVALYQLENTDFESLKLTLDPGYYTIIIYDGKESKVVKIKIDKNGSYDKTGNKKNKMKQNGEIVNEPV